jgi:hypothetical protein
MILEVIYYKEKIKIIFIGYYLTINDTSKSNSHNYEMCRKMPFNYKCISS